MLTLNCKLAITVRVFMLLGIEYSTCSGEDSNYVKGVHVIHVSRNKLKDPAWGGVLNTGKRDSATLTRKIN